MSKFCVNSLSTVYHCAKHNLPTLIEARKVRWRRDTIDLRSILIFQLVVDIRPVGGSFGVRYCDS